ncbi:MAG: 5-oxoprolinase [Hyphomicrobiales bacterium]|nr:5-oxoprolinase [Hyphomicrobiales bacterium]
MRGQNNVSFFIGTDVGGTFTDLWITEDSGETRVFKSPTTRDVLGGVIDALRLAAESYALSFDALCARIDRFGHGTTVGLNALLTGNVAKTAILTTRGFADTLEIGRLRRQTSGLNETEVTDVYQRNRHPPLVPRALVIEIDERIDVNGRIICPLDEAQARTAIKALKQQGVEAIAVCTLFATVNPVHEKRIRDIAAEELPGCFISMSHDISPNIGEYARMSTTAANASLGPLAGRYLAKLEATLREAGMKVPIMMMTCAGGVLPTSVLNDRPAYALFSGPAAGVMGSQAMGGQIGLKNILTTDIGGTSFDVGVIVDGRPIMRSDISVAGADIRVHSIDVDSIGAGGGSIASVRTGGELQVGPRSAGANPGPACYLRGGKEPTATDADLVLGVLDPSNFIGGRMTLDVQAAKDAIEEYVAKPLNMSVTEAAWGIRKILDSRMADLLRRMTIERGYNPRDFTLFANGGAGPSHAWVLAAELGLDGFVVPAAATAQSAFGTANSDLVFSTERPSYARIQAGRQPNEDELDRIRTGLQIALEDVRANLKAAAAGTNVTIEKFLSIRFRGQSNHLDIATTGESFDLAAFQAVTASFQKQYETLFGKGASYAGAGFEILSVRVTGIAALPPPSASNIGQPLQRKGSRPVVFDNPAEAVDTVIFHTVFPDAATDVRGPCIIEFPGQSVVVPPGARATADAKGNLHVRFSA